VKSITLLPVMMCVMVSHLKFQGNLDTLPVALLSNVPIWSRSTEGGQFGLPLCSLL
jgi:hypothetical protein